MLPSKPIFICKLLLHNSSTFCFLWTGKDIKLLITFYCTTGKYFLTNINLFIGRDEGNDTIIISSYFFISNQNDTFLPLSSIPFDLRKLHPIILLNCLYNIQDCSPQIIQCLCIQLLAQTTRNVL